MKWKVIIGIILLAGGLGAGVWEWITGSFAGSFPVVGFVLFAVGLYLVLAGVFERKKEKPIGPIEKIAGTAGVLTVSYLVGQLAYDKLSEFFRSKSADQKLSNEELIALEKHVDAMRIEGQLDPERYVRAKELILELKRRRGLA
ncbi:MAG: hypothetical protein QW385_00690 [Thermoproteota archaeon]